MRFQDLWNKCEPSDAQVLDLEIQVGAAGPTAVLELLDMKKFLIKSSDDYCHGHGQS